MHQYFLVGKNSTILNTCKRILNLSSDFESLFIIFCGELFDFGFPIPLQAIAAYHLRMTALQLPLADSFLHANIPMKFVWVSLGLLLHSDCWLKCRLYYVILLFIPCLWQIERWAMLRKFWIGRVNKKCREKNLTCAPAEYNNAAFYCIW